jgi:hypothetical protein
MKNYTKILMSIFLFTFISLNLSNIVSAQSNIYELAKNSVFLMSLKDYETKVGFKSDGLVTITSPKSGKTYKTGDTLTIKWENKDNKKYDTTVVLVYEDAMMPVGMYSEMDRNFYNVLITDEMPSGKYFVVLGDESSLTRFAVSNTFTIKTKSDYEGRAVDITNARNKASDAAAMAVLAGARAYAEMYYDKTGSYTDLCKVDEQPNFGIKNSVEEAGDYTGKQTDCDSTANAYAAEVKLKSKNSYFCVDSTGFGKEQTKSKGSKATACDGSVDKTKNRPDTNGNSNSGVDKAKGIVIKKIINLDDKYSPEKTTKFSVKIEDDKGKPFTVSDRSFSVSAMITQIDTGYSMPSLSFGTAIYNAKKKVWDFDVVMPSDIGKYVIDITAYCNIVSNSECYKKIGDKAPYINAYVYITGSKTSSSKSVVKILTPNGGEKITNTGSVDIKYMIPTTGGYFTEFFLIPSSNTSFNLVNPKNGIRGYSIGGSGSSYDNYSAVQGGPWSMGQVPDGKYKLRAYLYPYRENLGYSVSEAIGMDESDGYFMIDTSKSNTY